MRLSPDELQTVNEMFRNGEVVRVPAMMSATDNMINDMMNIAEMVQGVHEQAAHQELVDHAMQEAQHQFAAHEQAAHQQAVAHEHVGHEQAAHEHVAHEVGDHGDHAHDLAEGHGFNDHTPAVARAARVDPGLLERQSLQQIIATLAKR